jgi:hypothetical protein
MECPLLLSNSANSTIDIKSAQSPGNIVRINHILAVEISLAETRSERFFVSLAPIANQSCPSSGQ